VASRRNSEDTVHGTVRRVPFPSVLPEVFGVDLRLVTAPLRALRTAVGLLFASVFFLVTLVIIEVAGVYYYLRYVRPAALDRLLDGTSTVADLTGILSSADVILVMVGLVPVNLLVIYIAEVTDTVRDGE